MPDLQAYLRRFEEQVKEHDLLPEGKEIIVLVSGGKDSTALIFLLEEHRKKHPDLNISYLNVLFPQDMFGEDVIDKQGKIAKDLKQFTSIVPATPRNVLITAEEPCRRCKDIRTKEIAHYLQNKDPNKIVILTGHTIDDVLAYFAELFKLSIKTVITDIDFSSLENITLAPEQLEHFSRFQPRLVLSSGVTLGKPLLSFNRRDINAILAIADIHRHVTCCLYSCRRPKRNLFQILDYMTPEEVAELYGKYTLQKLLEELKKHVTNYDKALEELKTGDYAPLLL